MAMIMKLSETFTAESDVAVMDLVEERVQAICLISDTKPGQLRFEAEVLSLLKDRIEEGMKKKRSAATKAGETPAMVAVPVLLMIIDAKQRLAKVLKRQEKLVACMSKTRTNFELPGQSKRVRAKLARGAKIVAAFAEDNAAEEQVHLSKLIHAKVALTEMLTTDDGFATFYHTELRAAEQDVEKLRKPKAYFEREEEMGDTGEDKKEFEKPKLRKEEEQFDVGPKEYMPGNVRRASMKLRLEKRKEMREYKTRERAIDRSFIALRRARRSQNENMLAMAAEGRFRLSRRPGKVIKKQAPAFVELGEEPERQKKMERSVKSFVKKNEQLALAEAERAAASAEQGEGERRMRNLDGKFKEVIKNKKSLVRPLVEEVEKKIVGLENGKRCTLKMGNSLDRLVAHGVADFHEVAHKSEGKGKDRVTVVFKPKGVVTSNVRLLDIFDKY